MLRKSLLALLALAIGMGFSVPAQAAKRIAMVIGNAHYTHAPDLPNPGNDAGDMANLLSKIGFQVIRANELDFDAMRRSLRSFSEKAEGADMAVVFYAGHGIEVDGRNFLVPIDAKLRSDRDITYEAIPLDMITDAVSGARGLRLVMLDACRDNPFAASMKRSSSTRSIGRGLARIEPTTGTLVSYAAREGTTAADGDGRNSPYTTALLTYLDTPGLEINLLFRKVRDKVMSATGRKQQPFTYGSLPSQEIYLVKPSATIQGKPSSAETAILRKELEDLKTQFNQTKEIKKQVKDLEQQLSAARKKEREIERLKAELDAQRKRNEDLKRKERERKAASLANQTSQTSQPQGSSSKTKKSTEPRAIASIGSWTAYEFYKNGEKNCYAAARPIGTKPRNVRRDPVHFLVTHKSVVNTIIGYNFKKGSTASLQIGGKKWTMFTENDGAWLNSTANDRAVVAAMRRGSRLKVTGTAWRGTKTIDTYSLRGVTKILNRIERACRN